MRLLRPWFRQAQSDTRAARALLDAPFPLEAADVGCHVAALCAQTVEKSIKGYILLNGATPAMDHRPDKYLPDLLTKHDPLLRHEQHHAHLSTLFDIETRSTVEHLLDLTPGGKGNRTDLPNTEYPWTENGEWRHCPSDAAEFAARGTIEAWLRVATRVHATLYKLWIAVDRGTCL